MEYTEENRPVVAQPKGDKVELVLVLPKQVWGELLYGFAEKPVQQQYQECSNQEQCSAVQ